MVFLTGGQIILEHLKREKVPYIVGIPGHGCIPMMDAFVGQEHVKPIMVRHEQSGPFLADGYYRASGKPLCVFTSVGPGALNTITGMATAFVDSVPMVVFTGSVQTYMMGRGILQEIERKRSSDNWRAMEPVVKRSWQVTRVDQLPRVLAQAFKVATSGRPGPVHIDLPIDVQADAAEVELLDPEQHRPMGRQRGDSEQVERAATLLLSAERPAIIAGGGVVNSNASEELRELAEKLGAPVLTTFRGVSKGVFPEDHPLYGFYPGHASPVGNQVTRNADVILVVGSRLRDEATGSFVPGDAMNIPPTKVIHVDIDVNEIGKNIPTEVGIVGDAKAVLSDILKTVARSPNREYRRSKRFRELQSWKERWERDLRRQRASHPMSIQRVIWETRKFLDRDAIVLTSAGLPQELVHQQLPVYSPRSYLASGGFSTMGWGIPAAIGAKLARPDRKVIDIEGDGSFLLTASEMATAQQYDARIVVLILNNYGWISIRDHQLRRHGEGRSIATEFIDTSGKLCSPDFVKLAEAFSCYGERVERPEDIGPALWRAFESGKPAIVEAIVARDYPISGGKTYGTWDLAPLPAYLRRRSEVRGISGPKKGAATMGVLGKREKKNKKERR